MKKIFIKILSLMFMFGALSTSAIAVDKLHFVVPGGAGGGWDGCARGTGEALVKSGLLESASFENMSGGGGGKALAWMIKTQPKTLLWCNQHRLCFVRLVVIQDMCLIVQQVAFCLLKM